MTQSLQLQINEQQQEVAQRKRYAQNLAESLMAKLQIPQGRHLVALLGTGMVLDAILVILELCVLQQNNCKPSIRK